MPEEDPPTARTLAVRPASVQLRLASAWDILVDSIINYQNNGT